MNGAEEEKEDKFVKYGPMLLKEPTKVVNIHASKIFSLCFLKLTSNLNEESLVL